MGTLLENARISYWAAVIEYYNQLTHELDTKDWVFHAQHMQVITDLRVQAKVMRATAFYLYAITIMEKMLD